jgi:hypothetical protein
MYPIFLLVVAQIDNFGAAVERRCAPAGRAGAARIVAAARARPGLRLNRSLTASVREWRDIDKPSVAAEAPMPIIAAKPFGVFSPQGLRRAVFVVVSIALGTGAGYVLGSRTGVKDALEAGQSIDAETLSKALAWKPEVASVDLRRRREIAQLLDDVRSARAQIESLRHEREALRPGERLRALEAAREAGAARLDRLEARLSRLERPQVDPTPTGSVPKAAERKEPPPRLAPERPRSLGAKAGKDGA